MNVYLVKAKQHYFGIALIAAKNAERANQIIKDLEDKNGVRGLTPVSEDNVEHRLTSNEEGLILNSIVKLLNK